MKPAATARVLKKVETVTEITGFHLEKTAPELNWKLRRNLMGQLPELVND